MVTPACFGKIFFLTLSLIWLPLAMHAQEVISTSLTQMNYKIPFRPADGGLYVNGNAVLRELAKDVVREPWQVKVQVSFTLSMTIYEQDEKNILSILFINPGISGDKDFRRFPVSDVLFPANVNMKLKWANRFDTTSFSEVFFSKNSLDYHGNQVFSLPVPDFDPKVDTLMVRDVELFYDSAGLKAFKNRLELIHDYYASVILLDSLELMAAGIDLEDQGGLPVNYMKIEEMNKALERIQVRDFPLTLLHDGLDPGRLSDKYNAMFRQSRSLTYTYIDALKKRGAVSWSGNVDSLAGYFTGRILSYVLRTKLMDRLQSRIYQDWLDHCFDQSSFPFEENVLGLLLSKCYPDAQGDTIKRYVAGRIYLSYQNKARQLMEQYQYSEAFLMMDHARRFAECNPFNNSVVPDNNLLTQAAYGIYNSYTGIAQECIRNRKFNMADSYLAKADLYAKEHATLIVSDSLYLAVYSGLFFQRNSECDQLLEQKEFGAALDCYHSLETKYDSADLIFVEKHLDEKKNQAMTGLLLESVDRLLAAADHHQPDTLLFYYEQTLQLRNAVRGTGSASDVLDSLAPAIGRIKMDRFFYAGKQALDQRQFTLALTRLSDARSVSDQYGISRDQSFDSVYRATMKNCLIIQLGAAQKKIWANQFDSAKAALEQTRTTGFGYGLQDDLEFISTLGKFAAKIREQQCRNIQDSVSLKMIGADRAIAQKNYFSASGYLKQALALNDSAIECGFSNKAISDTLIKYSQAAGYQQKLLSARGHVASGDYVTAVNELTENERNYQLFGLDRFGLHSEGVYDFISERSNPYLTEQAISHFNERGDTREALRYLRLLRSQGFPDRSANVTQNLLGKSLAMNDYQLNPKDSGSRLVEQYTLNDDWYEIFRAAYLDEWKRLVNAEPALR